VTELSRRPLLVAMTVLTALTVGSAGIATANALAGPAPVPASVDKATSNAPTPTPDPSRSAPPLSPKQLAASKSAEAARVLAAMPRKPVGVTPKPKVSPSYVEGVQIGEECTAPGAVGHTLDDTLMTCGPTVTDTQNRWRKVEPPTRR